MPEKAVTFYSNDPPCITEDPKRLIKQRQRAFSSQFQVLSEQNK